MQSSDASRAVHCDFSLLFHFTSLSFAAIAELQTTQTFIPLAFRDLSSLQREIIRGLAASKVQKDGFLKHLHYEIYLRNSVGHISDMHFSASVVVESRDYRSFLRMQCP